MPAPVVSWARGHGSPRRHRTTVAGSDCCHVRNAHHRALDSRLYSDTNTDTDTLQAILAYRELGPTLSEIALAVASDGRT